MASNDKEDGSFELNRRTLIIGAAALGGAASLATNVAKAADLTAAALDSVAKAPAPQPLVNLNLVINGKSEALSIEPRVTLLDALRERLQLTGTKKGCDHGQCGACTVLVNGKRVNSCLTLAATVDGDHITTVEGLADGNMLSPLQQAFIQHDGFQCGYCTPGQLCSATAMLEEFKTGQASAATPQLHSTTAITLTEDETRERMSGNLCRCGAYNGIVEAIRQVSGGVE